LTKIKVGCFAWSKKSALSDMKGHYAEQGWLYRCRSLLC
jgi:hypothetical protein